MNAIGMTGSVEEVKNPHAIPFGIPEQSKDCLEMQPIRWGALVMLAEMRSWVWLPGHPSEWKVTVRGS